VQPANDWFLTAILNDGSVSSCLEAVISELDLRRAFVAALKNRLDPPTGTSVDAVTDLSNRLKPIENTLRARLPLLLPDRPGAWFRVPAARSGGPFSTSIVHEPVFAPYGSAPPQMVREALLSSWNAGAASVGVFRVGIRCLWLSLLELNARYKAINSIEVALPSGMVHRMMLDGLPDGLQDQLDCRSLRAFLGNVKMELISCRQRLDACKRDLLAASDLFFDQQSRPGRNRTGAWRDKADEFRDEQSRRRASTGSERAGAASSPGRDGGLKTARDLEALRYFGFSEFPTQEELRKRYLDLAKRFHPDATTGHEEKFKMLSRVYEHLLQRVAS
jgi:hypothetical protein